MPFSVSVSLPSAAALRRKLMSEILLVPTAALIHGMASFTLRETRAGAPRDGLALSRSIAAEVKPLEARIRSKHPGALAVEFGRKPGTPPPPAAALRGWAGRRGLAGAEFVIARAISRRGIRGRFFARRAFKKLIRQELPRLISEWQRDVRAAWGRP